MSMPDPAASFAATYAEARAKFVAAARSRGYALETHEHPDVRGAEGEALSMDVASTGSRDAPAMLVITSGTHGVEGFCGSGCQVGLLGDDSFAAAVAACGAAVVMVHAVNPHGFSHLRRTNEGNVDMNRNFRAFAAPPAANAAYAEVHPFVVPSAWPPPPENEAKIAAYLRERGPAAFQQAVSGGQCEFPDGLFYGGTAPAWSNATLRSVLREHGRGRRRVTLVDVHTGLGPCGHGEKLSVGTGHAASVARTRATFGADVTSYFDGSSTSAALTGVIDQAVRDECPSATFTGIGLEYGTIPLMETMQALRADQWLANQGGAESPQRPAIKRAIRDAFYVDRPDWKAMVWAQARVAALQALRGLAA